MKIIGIILVVLFAVGSPHFAWAVYGDISASELLKIYQQHRAETNELWVRDLALRNELANAKRDLAAHREKASDAHGDAQYVKDVSAVAKAAVDGAKATGGEAVRKDIEYRDKTVDVTVNGVATMDEQKMQGKRAGYIDGLKSAIKQTETELDAKDAILHLEAKGVWEALEREREDLVKNSVQSAFKITDSASGTFLKSGTASGTSGTSGNGTSGGSATSVTSPVNDSGGVHIHEPTEQEQRRGEQMSQQQEGNTQVHEHNGKIVS